MRFIQILLVSKLIPVEIKKTLSSIGFSPWHRFNPNTESSRLALRNCK